MKVATLTHNNVIETCKTKSKESKQSKIKLATTKRKTTMEMVLENYIKPIQINTSGHKIK